MVYRIYTENRNKADIVAMVSQDFPGFTLYECEGYWQGQPEQSLVFEIITLERVISRDVIDNLAQRIKDHNHQQAVLVTCSDCDRWFI